jgi:benzoyl-CoA reductase subunit D
VRPTTDTDEVSRERERFVTAGVDIGMRAVKVALLAHDAANGSPRVLSREIVTLAGRCDIGDVQIAIREGWFRSLRGAGLVAADVALVASTGQAHCLAHVGHLYRGLSLRTGVRFLFPQAIAVLDVGARQLRCTRLETSGCARGYAATPKAESWGGDLLDGFARSNGRAVPDRVQGPASVAAYEGVAARAAKLMQALSLDGPTAITGALAGDASFLDALARRLVDERLEAVLLSAPDAVFTGAFGAALLAARRFLRAVSSRPRVGVASTLRQAPAVLSAWRPLLN